MYNVGDNAYYSPITELVISTNHVARYIRHWPIRVSVISGSRRSMTSTWFQTIQRHCGPVHCFGSTRSLETFLVWDLEYLFHSTVYFSSDQNKVSETHLIIRVIVYYIYFRLVSPFQCQTVGPSIHSNHRFIPPLTAFINDILILLLSTLNFPLIVGPLCLALD